MVVWKTSQENRILSVCAENSNIKTFEAYSLLIEISFLLKWNLNGVTLSSQEAGGWIETTLK